jgi:butyrate kinase
VWHVLNQKAVAREYAESGGFKYENLNLIIAHLGGGISVAAHKKGRAVDVNNALNGDGPYTPTRAGSIPALQLVEMALSGDYTLGDFKSILSKKGGLIAHLGTHDALEINERIYSGDEKAEKVFKAMAYNLAKEITGLIPAFDGEKCDQVILTGGLAKDEILIKNTMDYLASSGLKITVIPGERELAGLRNGALRVLAGIEQAREYKG